MPGIGEVYGNRYEVIRQIASGGTSRVYLVADRHIGRILAMKVMERKQLGTAHFARSEIESLRAVHYPMFPQIHDAFCDDGHICIVSEYVKGTALSVLCSGRGLPKHRSLVISQYICEALVYLHGMRQPLLYLDLKPENIIISDDGMPHLIDFGIAGWLASKHIPVGTIGYSPPEQYRSDAVMDERTDIFAFGMTYYAIRCGVPPDPDLDKALYNIRHSAILSHNERSFLVKCCAPSMEDRYPSAREVLKQIRHIRAIPNRIRKIACTAFVAAAVLISGSFAITQTARRIKENNAADELVRQATRHMKDGQYTPEGIGIIKACINSGNLSERCEQDFIFEVAMNALLVSADYKTAAAYFARLDPARYPSAPDYLKLCSLQNGFDHDPEEAAEVIGKLYSDISGLSPSVQKYENLMFIALCYRNYDADPADGAGKALSVLRLAGQEIDGLEDNRGIDPDELQKIRKRLDDLTAVEEMRVRNIKKMIGDSNED